MDKTQEEKFEAYLEEPKPIFRSTEDRERYVWESCLEANGIGEGYWSRDENRIQGSAPSWVIDMMRTGKPVLCNVDGKDKGVERNIVGFILGARHPYIDDYVGSWKHAKPVPAWNPKDGEAVLTRVMDRAEIGYIRGGFVLVRGTTLPLAQADVIPLDGDKLGKPWSEI